MISSSSLYVHHQAPFTELMALGKTVKMMINSDYLEIFVENFPIIDC